MQELKTPRFPLIYTSKSASVDKRWQGLCQKQTKLLTNTANLFWKHLKEEWEKSCCELFGLVPLPHFHWSNLFWPAPFWVALLKQHLQGGPPAGSLYRNLGEAKRGKKKKSMEVSLDVSSRRCKQKTKRILQDPRRLTSRFQTRARKARWWIYLRDCILIFLQTGQ